MPVKEFALIIVKMQRFAINSDVHFSVDFIITAMKAEIRQLTEKISIFKDW